MEEAVNLIKKYEGCRLTAYQDTLGLWTIGYGHLLYPQTGHWVDYTITQQQADELLESDIGQAHRIAQRFPHWEDLNDTRQAVLISMSFQMGDKPLHWPHFMAALEAQDYHTAAIEGLDSLWAKQTPRRAREEMVMLEMGTNEQS